MNQSTQLESFDCDKCQDKGGYLVNKDGYELWKVCECAERRRINRIMKASSITDDFRKLGFNNYRTEGKPAEIIAAKDMAMQYLKNFEAIRKERKNSIGLVGQVGAGKTHLLIAIANNLMSKSIAVLYFPWVEGMNDLKSNWDELERKIKRMQEIDVLLIDDLFKGRENPTPWQLEQIYSVINYRYLNHLPIMLSSEKDFETLMDIDEAIGSRLYQMCKDYQMIFKGRHLNHRLEG